LGSSAPIEILVAVAHGEGLEGHKRPDGSDIDAAVLQRCRQLAEVVPEGKANPAGRAPGLEGLLHRLLA
jgi:hypothetical protein